MKTIDTVCSLRNHSSWRCGLAIIPLGLAALLAISQKAQAVSPPPDGGYPGGNTATGQSALLNLQPGGIYNTAIGIYSLLRLIDGDFCTGVGAGTLLLNTADENTAVGAGALLSNTTGSGNTADGAFSLFSNTTGAGNTATGWLALFSNATGSSNTASGVGTLSSNTTGFSNTATGSNALYGNTDGYYNTANGTFALVSNVTGAQNTAVGAFALLNNTADSNTATGAFALHDNTTGGTLATSVLGYDVGPNTAVGSHALESNTDSSGNTAVGYQALGSMVTGPSADPQVGISTAVGFQALANINGPSNGANDAFGYQALFNLTDGNGNVAIGNRALIDLTDGTSNVAVGTQAGSGLTSGFGNVYIGTGIGAGASNENFHTYIDNINSTNVSGAGTDTVTVDLSTGLLGHLTSSRRYKEDIKPMDNASETLYRLRPVTFRYTKHIDRTQSLDYGLIAEDVAEADPNLAIRDGNGQIESVRYTAVNAMLLNEFLKEHCKIEEQQRTITQLKSKVAKQEEKIEALTAGLQKVSAQIEMNNFAPQVVLNNPTTGNDHR